MVSAIDYMERVLGYAPRTAQDRLRVARALGTLPQLTAALAAGELAFSAVRELTRVATPATEGSWIAAANGKNLRQIEDLVADHRPGDRPEDPPDPEARTHVVRFELAAETFALLRQARVVLDDEHGKNLPDDAFVASLCNAVLDGASTAEPIGRAKFQIAITVCQRCRQGWQEGAGAQITIDPAAVDRAMCDAQHVGSIDGAAPERAHHDIPPSVARFVWRRDGGRCRIPGCRSARGLELHHLVHRVDGGSHDPSNVVLTCFSCHQSHHAGTLTISGTADHLEVHRAESAAPAGDTRQGSVHTGAHARTGAPVGAARAASSYARTAEATSPSVTTRVEVGTEDRTSSSAEAESVVASASAGHTRPLNARPDPTAADRVHVGADRAIRSTLDVDTAGQRSSGLDATILQAQAKAALTALGWRPTVARAAVAAAVAEHVAEWTLERLIFEALRRCPTSEGATTMASGHARHRHGGR